MPPGFGGYGISHTTTKKGLGMRANMAVWKMVILGAAMTVAGAGAADAKTRGTHIHTAASMTPRAGSMRVSAAEPGAKRVRIGGHGRKQAYLSRGASYGSGYSYGGGLQCVPFARENTGIELAGNAAAWWAAAAGIYERGSRPEVGSILNFRANGRMRSGHVAVVSNVDNARTVEIDHANWANHGGIARNVTVLDVSPDNDWSAVRVQLGSGDFGSVYPTYGFIYDRPDHGAMVANNATAPMPNALNPPPRDLRTTIQPVSAGDDDAVEVAEATPRRRYGIYRVSSRVVHRKSEAAVHLAGSRTRSHRH